MASSRTAYRVGPSGWSYADWKGVVYPSGASSRFDALAYIARFFDAVEVNVSFYRPVTPRMSASWVSRVSDEPAFRFVFKLHRVFTHERQPYTRTAVNEFLAGLEPVAEASRLGCVLVQFPWSFRRSPQSVEWLRRLGDDFGIHALVVELRHDSWLVPDTASDMREINMGWCNIDQPRLAHCVGPSEHAIGPVGYVRFHGRRADTWFTENAQTHDRYNYLYSTAELHEWLPRVQRVGETASEVFVFFNNHYRGQGPANALELRAMLAGGQVEIPEQMIGHFPHLAPLRRSDVGGFPTSLF